MIFREKCFIREFFELVVYPLYVDRFVAATMICIVVFDLDEETMKETVAFWNVIIAQIQFHEFLYVHGPVMSFVKYIYFEADFY